MFNEILSRYSCATYIQFKFACGKRHISEILYWPFRLHRQIKEIKLQVTCSHFGKGLGQYDDPPLQAYCRTVYSNRNEEK